MSRISIPTVEQSPDAAKPLLPTDIDFPVINVRLAAGVNASPAPSPVPFVYMGSVVLVPERKCPMSFLNDIDHFPGSGEREFHDRSREGLLVAVSTGHPGTPKAHEPEPDTALIHGFMRESARAKLTI